MKSKTKLNLLIFNLFLLVLIGGIVYTQRNNSEPIIKSIDGTNIKVNELDDFLKTQMDSLAIPGLSFAYINEDKIVYSKNFGVVNTETQEPVTDKTLFDAASISKTVFSFFAMLIVDKGLLNLDKPLYKYLENPDIDYDQRYKKINARMALSHTTGFPNWRYLNEKGYDPNGRLRIEFEPGTQYQYSGEGYQYLAQVMAHILETDMNGLQMNIEKEIFEPLNIEQNSFVWNDYLELNRANGHIKGLPNKGYSSSSNDPNFNAAASLQTNAPSYAKILIALMNNKLLTKSSNKEMLSIQSERKKSKNRDAVKYGFGVIINETSNGTNYAHSGDNGSATSQFLFNDKYNSGYVFFTNMELKPKAIFDTNLRRFLSN